MKLPSKHSSTPSSGIAASTSKRCGLYLRVSSSDQSTDLQRRELLDYCQRRGWVVTKIYEDKASGVSSRNRKMLEELLSDCRRRSIDTVLVWKLDRLFRSLKGMIETLAQLSEWNIEFVSITDNVSLESSQGRLMFHLISAFAEFEADLIKSRVVAGLQAAVARGVKLGRPISLTQNVKRQIIELRQQRVSVRDIARRVGVAKSSVQRVISACTDKPVISKSEKPKESDG